MEKFTYDLFLQEMTENILPFWMDMIDCENGGFYGEADFYGNPLKNANKGGILCSRILWSFSAAYRMVKNKAYLDMASYAKDFLLNHFIDKDFGGVYWETDCYGNVVDSKKHFYNTAFAIYGLSEYYLATGEKGCLDILNDLYDYLERHALDREYGGYYEAVSRDNSPLADVALSKKDLNCPKTMNTNLHILEAYTNLYRAMKSDTLKISIRNLIDVFLNKILDGDSYHLMLYFSNDWEKLSGKISFGHDIETSWLLLEAAEAIEDDGMIHKVQEYSTKISEAVLMEGIDRKFGGLHDAKLENGRFIEYKEWWVQAEAVVGFYNAYELTKDEKFQNISRGIWNYIQDVFVDKLHGEWHGEVLNYNIVDKRVPKVSGWKCPYHNTRMCIEMMKRFRR